MQSLVLKLINFYISYLSFDHGILSILAPNGACRYSPTCSVYAREAIEKYGVIKGLNLGFRRVISCR